MHYRIAAKWSFGTITVLALLMTLWLPYLNAASSYRDVFLSLKAAVPAATPKVAIKDVGESERAVMEYFSGIQPLRWNTPAAATCDYLLEERPGNMPPRKLADWKMVCECSHPSNRPKEIFALYKRIVQKHAPAPSTL